MFRLFDLIDIAEGEVNAGLIQHSLKNFHTFNTTELENIHSRVLTMIKSLDVKKTNFDFEFNRIMAGAIIYYFAYEGAKYSNTLYNPGQYDLKSILKSCGIAENSTFKPLEIITQIGIKALAGDITFNKATIDKYFNMFWKNEDNPLRDILLKRFDDMQSRPVLTR